MLKVCAKCKQEKNLSCFNKNNWLRDKKNSFCKGCSKRLYRKYYQSYEGKLRHIYKQIGQLHDVEFTVERFLEWAETTRYKNLYDEWVLSGYVKGNAPSIYKTGKNDSFTMDNIQLITYSKLKNKQHTVKGVKNGRSKFTKLEVSYIRGLYENTNISQVSLAERYNVGTTSMNKLLRYKTYTTIKAAYKPSKHCK